MNSRATSPKPVPKPRTFLGQMRQEERLRNRVFPDTNWKGGKAVCRRCGLVMHNGEPMSPRGEYYHSAAPHMKRALACANNGKCLYEDESELVPFLRKRRRRYLKDGDSPMMTPENITGLIALAILIPIYLWKVSRRKIRTTQAFMFSVAEDFSRFPAGADNGPYSGESLRVFIVGMLEEDALVNVNLDGTMGYASSFLKAAFQGLGKEFPRLRDRLILVSLEDSSLVTEIWEYIEQ